MCSFTPSRIGIITSRRSWSKPSVTGVNRAGVSLGSVGTCWAPVGCSETIAPMHRRQQDEDAASHARLEHA